MEPAPIASMANNFPVCESNLRIGIIGAIIDIAVMMATVDEPCAVFIIRAIKKGIISPRPVLLIATPAIAPIQVSLIIIPNIPQAAIIIRMGPAFSIAVSKKALSVLIFLLAKSIKAKTTPISKAITGFPVKAKTLIRILSGPVGKIFNKDPVAIRIKGITMDKNDNNTEECTCSGSFGGISLSGDGG